jgi:hypothetical protein
MPEAGGPALVVVSFYDARPLAELQPLLDDLATVPAGAAFEVLVVVNQTLAEPVRIDADLPGFRVLHRPNRGFNIGAWDHGWRASPGRDAYVFLQHECRLRRPSWLRPFLRRLRLPGVGLVGERENPTWDAPWAELERRFAGHTLPQHAVDGVAAPRLETYRRFWARHGVPLGERGDHLQTLVLAASGATLTRCGGFLEGRDYGEAIAAEIAVSKRIQALGLGIEIVGPEPFTYVEHPQWRERAAQHRTPPKPPRLGLDAWLRQVVSERVFDARPWLVLGKGPSFTRLTDEHRRAHQLFALNHVVRQEKVTIAHAIDLDVAAACAPTLDSNCRFLLMPRVPHVDSRPGERLLEQCFAQVPELYELDREGRLVWYDCSTSARRFAGSDVVDVRWFSSEAAFGVLGRLAAGTGNRVVRTLGVDGGRAYSSAFGDLADSTRLRNGQASFDRQFDRIERLVRAFDLDWRPLVEPRTVAIVGGEELRLPARVLAHLLRRSTAAALRVVFVALPATAPPGALIVPADSLVDGQRSGDRAVDAGDAAPWIVRPLAATPWLHPSGADADEWLAAFVDALLAGAVTPADVRRAIRRGHADRSLLALPPLAEAPGQGADDELRREATNLRRELAAVRCSRAWQVGALALQPLRWLGGVVRGGRA